MSRLRAIPVLLTSLGATCCYAQNASPSANTSIFQPVSTPAGDVNSLAMFVLLICAGIFFGMSALLIYAIARFRSRPGETTEPPQVFGSTQVELAWTIIPVLLITMLFLGTARVIFAVQDAPKPANALDVIAVGHQFWWEFRYPKYGVVTANELHVPQDTSDQPQATFLKLTSADVMHSFWVPRLAGKTDLLPNRVNEMWFDPREAGIFLGQCAQFCGSEHAKMLLRVYVDPPDKFAEWIKSQQRERPELPAELQNAGPGGPSTGGITDAQKGQLVFQQQACVNCHTIRGTMANGRFGPDLTHLMTRDTLGSGIVANTPDNLLRWLKDPNDFKPGCLMPAMHLTDEQNALITAYLLTLH